MKKIKWGLFLVVLALASGLVGFALMNNFITTSFEKQEVEKQNSEVVTQSFDSPCTTCVYIDKGVGTSYKTNPILRVSVYKDNELLKTYKTVSGRWNTQDLDRSVAGNESPSPNGKYIIQPEVTEWPQWVKDIYPNTEGFHPETGGVFLPYEPTFQTERSALGFHIDPSWGKDNGEDGTSACQGFETYEDYREFVTLINKNDITELNINYE